MPVEGTNASSGDGRARAAARTDGEPACPYVVPQQIPYGDDRNGTAPPSASSHVTVTGRAAEDGAGLGSR